MPTWTNVTAKKDTDCNQWEREIEVIKLGSLLEEKYKKLNMPQAELAKSAEINKGPILKIKNEA